jgi:hypothetical protein
MNWISVEDKLPEPGDVVLTFSLYDDEKMIYEVGEVSSDYTLSSMSSRTSGSKVSFWMPLPKKPRVYL